MTEAHVTTIMPVYNGEAFVEAALESLLAQSYPHHSIIAIDDGSQDSSLALLEKYRNVITVLTQDNAGIAETRNRGIRMATSSFIAFMDCDDLWDLDKLAVQMQCFMDQPHIQYCVTHIRHHLQEGTAKPSWLKPEFLEQDCPGYLPSTLVARRELFETVGFFKKEYTLTDDGKWFFDAKDMHVPMALLPQTLVTRRIHGANNSGQIQRLHGELIRIVGGSLARKRAR